MKRMTHQERRRNHAIRQPNDKGHRCKMPKATKDKIRRTTNAQHRLTVFTRYGSATYTYLNESEAKAAYFAAVEAASK